MPLQATSGAASYDAFGGGVAAVPQYIEDVFSTYLYTGNGSTQTITNGIDLAGKGGLVWTKNRIQTYNHTLISSANGVGYQLESNTTAALANGGSSVISSFNSDGFSVGNAGRINYSGDGIASWTFRKQPKFFDVVTYTGNGASSRDINHNLVSAPGFIIVKRTDSTSDWFCYAENGTVGIDGYSKLNTTAAEVFSANFWGTSSPTSTQFGVSSTINVNGATYVAYLFAHNAGGFGLTGTDNVISCGSFTTNGSGTATVSLGYEPQWVMTKHALSYGGDWQMYDSMRGMSVDQGQQLLANTSAAETTDSKVLPTSTGFVGSGGASTTYIYIAIRRGPMKVPTSGTSVFTPATRTGTGTVANVTGVGFPPDLYYTHTRGGGNPVLTDRLRGATKSLSSRGTYEEQTETTSVTAFGQDGVILGANDSDFFNGVNYSGSSYINWNFRRAPSFFDEVCETSTSATNKSITHNLAAVPELIIVKKRSASGTNWVVYASAVTTLSQYLVLNTTAARATSSNIWGLSSPTTTTFNINENSVVGSTGSTYVAYLFATCAGVSKVGSYTGSDSDLNIDCGFTSGARFVMIKRTDASSDWYVWDSARGIVSGNDPRLSLNTTAAEVTDMNMINTYSAGFSVPAGGPNTGAGATFIYLAIA